MNILLFADYIIKQAVLINQMAEVINTHTLQFNDVEREIEKKDKVLAELEKELQKVRKTLDGLT